MLRFASSPSSFDGCGGSTFPSWCYALLRSVRLSLAVRPSQVDDMLGFGAVLSGLAFPSWCYASLCFASLRFGAVSGSAAENYIIFVDYRRLFWQWRRRIIRSAAGTPVSLCACERVTRRFLRGSPALENYVAQKKKYFHEGKKVIEHA